MPQILRLALPSPLRRRFDYLCPAGGDATTLRPGVRLRLPFGNRKVVGLLLEQSDHSELALAKLKPAEEVLDQEPLLPSHLLELGCWAARYYHHSEGDALFTLLPNLLRQGEAACYRREQHWQVVSGFDAGVLSTAPRQQALWQLLLSHPQGLSSEALRALGYSADLVRTLAGRGALQEELREVSPYPPQRGGLLKEPALALNPEQAKALAVVAECLNRFQPLLLQGVTGSGKTEVYLQTIAAVLEQGRQALVLVPEIGLTPQTVARFKARFNCPVVALHSGLNDRERLDGWLAAKRGEAGIIIGTRSAVLTPLARPGVIILDEEHDTSFKQQEGFRYHARDLAVMRARAEAIPLVLGSATPALESLANAAQGRYRRLVLNERAGGAEPPQIELLDIRQQPLLDGLSTPLVERIRSHLARKEQVLLFLNRRGFSPTLMCHACGWIADCPSCDAHLTLHRSPMQLRCHHCDHQILPPAQCPHCQSRELISLGVGTERTETALEKLFPQTPVIRVDRDSTRRKGAMNAIVERIHREPSCLLIGTQMLAKGHHFPRVTLVAILDADAGLFSGDFRGMERMAQLILQVAGRAGRAERPGHVLMQTHQADHPQLRCLIEQGYSAFAAEQLRLRQLASLPPCSHYALLRAEAVAQGRAEAFLQQVRVLIERWPRDGVSLLGPIPSPMERRGGRYRAQLLLEGVSRAPLHRLLELLVTELEALPSARKVRWSLDVDPVDLF